MRHDERCQCYICQCRPRVGRTRFLTKNSEYRLETIWYDGDGWVVSYSRSSKKLNDDGLSFNIEKSEAPLSTWKYWCQENRGSGEEIDEN